MKLTDKAFYKRKAEKQPQPQKRLLAAGELFDVIAQLALEADQNQLRRKLEVLVNSGALPREEAERILRENNISPAPAQAMSPPAAMPAPGATGPEVPLQDKMQEFKSIGLNDQQIEQVMKISSDDGNQPTGTPASPIDGQRDSLSTSEIEGTGRIGQELKKDEGEPQEEPAKESPAPAPVETPTPPKSKVRQPQMPGEARDLRELFENKSPAEITQTVMSYISTLQQIDKRIRYLIDQLAEASHPVPFEAGNDNPQGYKNDLRKQIGMWQGKLSSLGRKWGPIARFVQEYTSINPEQFKDWAKTVEQIMARALAMAKVDDIQPTLGKPPQKTTPKQGPGRPDEQKQIEEFMKKKKEQPKTGQMAPSQSAPGSVPTPPGAPGAPDGGGELGMAPDLTEEKEDPRPLEEILEELKEDLEAVTQKIEDGETMMGGQELEPITTDTGANPSPAAPMVAREAVDQEAKEYYTDYWGEYGDQLTEDRVAEQVEMVDEVAATYGIKMTAAQVNRLTDLLAIIWSDHIPEMKSASDLARVDFIIRSGLYERDYDLNPAVKRAVDILIYQGLSDEMKDKHRQVLTALSKKSNKYIEKRNGKWVILQKGTGKVLSTHDSKEKAEASFRAMEMHKHGQNTRDFMTERERNQLGQQKHLQNQRPRVQVDTQQLLDMGFNQNEVNQIMRMVKDDPASPAWDEVVYNVPHHRGAQKMKQPKINDQLDDAVKLDKMEDKADDEDAMLARPGHLHMELEDQEMDGAYLKLTISWDPDADAARQSDDGLKHAVLSWVKGLESEKEFIDYGFLGQISFDEFDPEAGIAVASVRTKKPGDAPGFTKTEPKKAQMTPPSTDDIFFIQIRDANTQQPADINTAQTILRQLGCSGWCEDEGQGCFNAELSPQLTSKLQSRGHLEMRAGPWVLSAETP